MLRVNVGFLLKQPPGFSREMEIEAGQVRIAEDLDVGFLRGVIRFTRTHEGLLAQGRLRTEVACNCVRCLTDFALPLTAQLQDLFYYPPNRAVASDLVIPEDGNLDLGPLLREDLLLAIPMRVLCRPDCQGLCPHCGQNLNEGRCTCSEETRDPRWAALNALLESR